MPGGAGVGWHRLREGKLAVDRVRGSQSGSWVGPFDAALAGLAHQRPLRAAVDALLTSTLEAVGSVHGYIRLGGKEGAPLAVYAGRGLWAFDATEDLDEEVRRTGRPQWGPADHAASGARHLAAPVVVDGEVAGTLGVAFPGSGEVGPAQVDLLCRFASLVAVAYGNARLITTERSAREQEKALIRAGQALSSTLELRAVLNRILTELQKVVSYDTASVQELRGDQMVIVGGNGIDMDVFDGVGFDVVGHGVPNADVLRHRAPVIVPDILGDHPYHDFPHDAHEMSGVRGWLGVPLMFGNECIGMVTLDTFEPDFYTEDHADTALAFAAQAAIALQNARSFELARREVEERRRAETELRRANEVLQVRMREIEALQADLREQAVRDALTGLFNRRHLMDTLAVEVERSRREGRPLALAMIDVDHFKLVNDTRGHAAGDRVLVAVADYLGAQIEEGEVACRYGGEEFVVLLPGLDEAAAQRRAERWRGEIAATASPVDLDRPVTVSIGVAVGGATVAPPIDRPGERRGDDTIDRQGDGEALIRRADAAMYRAKADGRNRVEVAGSSDPVRTAIEQASWGHG